MELGHLLTRSGLTYPEVSSNVYNESFCQSGSSVSLPWVIYFEAFYLLVLSSFSCTPVICPKFVLFLTPLQFVYLFCNLSNCMCVFLCLYTDHYHHHHHTYLSWSWATCWPVPVSRIQKSLQMSTMNPSASWVPLTWVIYFEAFYLYIVSRSSCISAISKVTVKLPKPA